jgi:hypothetical protein
MRLIPLNSKNIEAVAYEFHSEEDGLGSLYVVFARGGAIYKYSDVTPHDVVKLVFAESAGAHWNKVKGLFSTHRLDGPELDHFQETAHV